MTMPQEPSNFSLTQLMMHVLDRLAHGEDFNVVVEQTGITAKVSEAIAKEKLEQLAGPGNLECATIQSGSFDDSEMIEDLLLCARIHGVDSEPDFEAGDLQGLVRAAWTLMSPHQRILMLQTNEASDALEGVNGERFCNDVNSVDADEWQAVSNYFGLDHAFEYADDQVLDYVNHFRLDRALEAFRGDSNYALDR
jgi:hypothetical protein